MPTMVNPRSLFLSNANPRLLTSPNADVLLSASTPIFHVNNSGVSTPTIITLNASLIAMDGTVAFTCEGGTLSSIAGNTCALNYETLTGDTAKVTATITYRNKTYSDTVEISKVYDGQNGVVGANNAVFYAWQRSATQPTGTPGDVQYSFPASGITNTSLANGWQKTLPTGTGPLWITAATASGTGTTDNVAANEWSSAVLLGQDGLPGNPGINSAPVTIYQRTATTTAPALPSAATTYTFSPAGLTGLTNGWTTTLPAATNGKYLWASTATAASTAATDSIPANEWATAQMLVQDGAAGTRGNVQVARAIPGSIWSDSEAALAISGAGYGTPQNRDIVTLYNNSASYSQQKYYDGSLWQVLAAYFPGSVIVDGTVDALKINSRGLDIKDVAGNIILSAGKSLAQQAYGNPNLVPNVLGFTVSGNASRNRNGDGRYGDGQYLFIGTTTDTSYCGANSPPCGIPSGATYTVSFDAQCEGANRVLNVDLFGGGIDTVGIAPTITNVLTRYKFTETTTHASMPLAYLRFFTTAAGGSNIVIANIKVELGGAMTAWSDNVITKANASTFIASAAINLAQIDKASITDLSAVSANIGFLTNRVNGQGQGMEVTSDVIRIYDTNNVVRVKMGNLG